MSNSQQPDLSGDRGSQSLREGTYRVLFLLCAVLSVATTIGIVVTLFRDTITFFQFEGVSIWRFLTSTTWQPTNALFGVLPLVWGTLVVTIGAAFIALPVGVLTAIYLSEYASDRMRSVLKPLLEILAGVPTVVYGYFAIVYITPFLRRLLFPNISTFNYLSASIVVGIMIIPMVASISEDAMNAVPDSLRRAGYGLGATKFSVSTNVVMPAAVSGIVSSFILAVSRAIGETMAVTLAIGTNPHLPSLRSVAGVPYLHPGDVFLNPGGTMTSAMLNTILSDLSGGSAGYYSAFAVGLLLFLITLAMNVISDVIAQRYREEY